MAEGTTHSGWARMADYLFGRNALIGLASFMLLVISGYATWSGMSDFIVGVQTGSGANLKQIGGLSVSAELLVIAIVVALTFLMWLALRETFGAKRRITERLVTLPLYLFLALWSVGFGYGFWWSLIAGEEATKIGLSGLQQDARDAASAVSARLEAVKVQLDSVVTWSESQMAREESSGGSCGIRSGAGRGPLYNARRSVRDQIASLRDGVKLSWIAPVQADLEALRKIASSLEGTTVAERQQRFEAIAANIRTRSRNIAARSNELGKSTATEMRAIAEAVAVAPGKTGFTCHDPTLAQRLRQAADQAGQPAVLKLREAAFNEGPAGVANAVKNLWSNVGSYFTSLIRYVFSGGEVTGNEIAGGEPITGRDLIALLATLGVDLGLLVLMVLNPPAIAPARTGALAHTQSQVPEISGVVIRQIAGAIETAIARAPGANLDWVRKHFIHHDGASYFIIPNLHSVSQTDKNEELRALAVNQLGGVLTDLDLVRLLTSKEWEAARTQEDRDSQSTIKGETMPNYGLFSKGKRMLGIAGWSVDAQKDLEVFRLIDREGLTPLLTVLNHEAIDKGQMLTQEQTKVLYIEHLSEVGSLTPEERPIIQRIADAEAELDDALQGFLRKHPDISKHVSATVEQLARKVSAQDDEIMKKWSGEQDKTYPISEINAHSIRWAFGTYHSLKLILEDLARKNSNTDLQAKIAEFLKPDGKTTAVQLGQALRKAS